MAVSGLLCAAIGLYPFAHSSFLLMLAFYWLVAATLLLFAYCLSTLFSKARVAGGAAAVLYALAMMPGYLMPSLQPYGGPGWALSCLLPPSAISLFASVLVKHEATQQGLTWSTIGMPVTVEHSFSASDVYGMLLLDAALYSLLLWYLDKVMPSDVGQRLPWAFPLSPHHWRQRWRQTTANVAAANERQRQRRGSWGAELLSGAPSASSLSSRDAPPAVRIEGLRKVFHTTDGMEKVAVDGLSLDIPRGQITALLGHNGAGKTTTISILSGVLPPTDGDAFFCTAGGQELSVRHDMGVQMLIAGFLFWIDRAQREARLGTLQPEGVRA
jgi:ABC-type multidrug transport system fused ATPase/permease subunit